MATLNSAMILAAGRGERMRPLTDNTPKPLLPVRGKPLIQYHIERLAAAGVTRIVINHAWLGEKLVDYLGDGSRFSVDILYSAEQQALETAGGIVQALPLLCETQDDSFIVINGDIFCDIDLSSLPGNLGQDLAHLVMVENPAHNPKGDFAFSGGRLTQRKGETLTFSGVAVYRRTFFADVQPGRRPLAPLLRTWIDSGRVSAHKHPGFWCDVGTPQRLAWLNEQELSEW